MSTTGPATAADAPAVDLEHVGVRYGDVVALEDVSLRIPTGGVVGLIGMNGSGKSTLFKTLLGLAPRASGRVTVCGGPPSAARRSGRVAYVPQSEAVDWDFPVSVRDVVSMGRRGLRTDSGRRPLARVLGVSDRADRPVVDEALERVGLGALAGRQIGALSGGQRKRVFVARALAQRARLLLLDEPFSGVDVASAQLIVGVLREQSRAGSTVLVSTHDLGTLPELADSAVLLRRTVLFHGEVAEALRPENLGRAMGLSAEAAR